MATRINVQVEYINHEQNSNCKSERWLGWHGAFEGAVVPVLGLWPGLVVLVDAVLVAGVGSAPEAGEVPEHGLAADAAEVHHSSGDSLQVETLVQLDGLEVIKHIGIFSRDLDRLVLDLFLLRGLVLQHEVPDAIGLHGVHHVEEVRSLWHPLATEIREVLVHVGHLLHLLPDPLGRDRPVLLDAMHELDFTQVQEELLRLDHLQPELRGEVTIVRQILVHLKEHFSYNFNVWQGFCCTWD